MRKSKKEMEVKEMEVKGVEEMEVKGVEEMEVKGVEEMEVKGVEEMEVKGVEEMEVKGVEEMKSDFIEVLENVKWDNEKIKELRKFVKNLRLEKGEEGGRKEELVELLNKWERLSIKEISEKMGISSKNVSSLLLYLKKGGIRICTDCEGKKFIERV